MTQMTQNRASVRREVLFHRGAGAVWELVGDPARVQEWFPGIEASRVSGDTRVVTLASGRAVRERIVTIDPLLRRFQYEIDLPLCRFHLSTLDVVPLDDDRCLVLYAADADPAVMALIIAGAAGAGLRNLATMLRGGD